MTTRFRLLIYNQGKLVGEIEGLDRPEGKVDVDDIIVTEQKLDDILGLRVHIKPVEEVKVYDEPAN